MKFEASTGGTLSGLPGVSEPRPAITAHVSGAIVL
jgi:hypothetical protein